MNNNLSPFWILLFISYQVISQSYPGFDNDNYNGIHGVMVNPANIADSRLNIDVNLFSISAIGATDYTVLSLTNVKELIGDNGFATLETFPSNTNEVLANLELLGPSFMFNLGEKQSLGIISRFRGINNYNNVNGQLLEGIVDGFPSENFDFEQNNLDGTTHFWGEIGVSYGRVLYNDLERHYLKGGITLKYLLGAGIAQGSSQTLSGNYDAGTDQVNLEGDFDYLISYDEGQEINDYFNDFTPGIGMDIGLVYEFRTRNSRMSGVNDDPRALNKYKVKVGVSLLDYGAIKYKQLTLNKYTLNASVSAEEVENDFIEAIENNATVNTIEGDVIAALPTSLRLNIDYQVMDRLYINLDLNQTMVDKRALFNNHRLNLLSLTPRYETKNVSAYIPVSYSELGAMAVGVGFRIGPLMVGSGSIISNLIADSSQMTNAYIGLKIPINH